MATARPCLAQLSRQCLLHPSPVSARLFSTTAMMQGSAKNKIISKKPQAPPAPRKKKEAEAKKKKKVRTTYKERDVKSLEMFSLLEAMRYIRAFEVGQSPTSVKYEIAIRLKGIKNAPVVRNRLRLPHPVKTDVRICVICPPDSPYAAASRAAGATMVGEEEIFEKIKDGQIEFDRMLCQLDSLPKLNKAALGRILGPKGLMPSTKTGTVVKDPASLIKDFIGAAEYRERVGVIRLAIGQLGFTPEEVSRNIQTLLVAVKKDMALLSDKANKELAEVVLSSTHSPGFPLSGNMTAPGLEITAKELSSS